MSGPEVMFTSYYENGSIKETGAYYKGKRHGNWMLFDDAGNKISEGNYSLGEKLGVWRVQSSYESSSYELRYENGERMTARKLE